LAANRRLLQRGPCGPAWLARSTSELELVAKGDETDDGYGDDGRKKENVHESLQADM
jgi:hypothetical protein